MCFGGIIGGEVEMLKIINLVILIIGNILVIFFLLVNFMMKIIKKRSVLICLFLFFFIGGMILLKYVIKLIYRIRFYFLKMVIFLIILELLV